MNCWQKERIRWHGVLEQGDANFQNAVKRNCLWKLEDKVPRLRVYPNWIERSNAIMRKSDGPIESSHDTMKLNTYNITVASPDGR